MLKAALTLFTGALFVVGIVYYLLWFQSDIKDIKNEAGSDLLSAEYLVMKKYNLEKAIEVSRVSADQGFYKNPNKLALNGNVLMMENKDKSSSTKSSTDKLLVEFEQKAFQRVIKNSKIKKADANGNVSIQLKDYVIKSQTSYYTAKDNTISTASKVVAEGVNNQIIGEQGFIYHLKSETMKMNGNVRGYFERLEN